jgi:methyl-accepting chemotaxis protein
MATEFVTSIVTGSDSFKSGQEAAKQALQKMKQPQKPNLAIVFCSIQYDYAAVMSGIKDVIGEEVVIVGCTSAGQFSDQEAVKKGICCALIASDSHQFFSGIGQGLKNSPIQAIEEAVREFPPHVPNYPHQAAMLFVDGLAGKGEEAVLAAASLLGPKVKFAGGAAADNFNFKDTVVLGNNQALSDAVSICLIASQKPIIISAKHGHKPISAPLRVTRSEGNILYEVEGRPPLEVWKEHLREKLKAKGIDVDRLTSKELSKVLLKYEAGLLTGDAEYKIRFPASCNPDGSFNFVCSMLEGSVITIMDSEEKDQIQSARQAAEMALEAAKGIELAGAVIFDCACRAMILREQFGKTTIETNKEIFSNLPFIGCETYGEIAMDMGQLSGFHNTTTVIMLFPA